MLDAHAEFERVFYRNVGAEGPDFAAQLLSLSGMLHTMAVSRSGIFFGSPQGREMLAAAKRAKAASEELAQVIEQHRAVSKSDGTPFVIDSDI
jgi:hypothetical protein